MSKARALELLAMDLGAVEALVREFQAAHGLKVDGWPGDVTREAIQAAQATPAHADGYTPAQRLKRARSATKHRTIYRLGQGGYKPNAPHPWDTERECDCSGFQSWVIGLPRHYTFGRHKWISTTDIYRDAMGAQALFRRIDAPVPGCLVVYGDPVGGGQGHVAIVTEGEGKKLRGIDCSYSVYNRSEKKRPGRGNAITERNIGFFTRKPSFCYCTPVWDPVA